MKSFEKKVIIVFVMAILSSLVQWWTLPIVGPAEEAGVIVVIFYSIWFVVNLVGVVWCSLALLALMLLRLASRYRSANLNYINDRRQVRFPAFFRFMKWLNTDD